MHYDLRLEFGGVLKCWAVPKGPSLNPRDRRLAIRVEDHPVEYADFEGTIPEGEYGAGPVIVWDRGDWTAEGSISRSLERGRLKFRLNGEKLRGGWMLVRMDGRDGSGKREAWLLRKEADEEARTRGKDIVRERPESVVSGRTIEELESADGAPAGSRDRTSSSTARRANPTRESPATTTDPALRDLLALPRARRATMPATVEPQLPTLVAAAPEGDEWLHELKYDGYRLICRVDDGTVKLRTRGRQDWTQRFPRLARAVRSLPVRQAVLDGEAVVVRPDGTTDFQALQNVMSRGSHRDVVYYAFDLIYLDGISLKDVPLIHRKEILETLLATVGDGAGPPVLRYSGHVIGSGRDVYREACAVGAEGIVSKRKDRPYREGRSRDWLKVKCLTQQEFVIVGWTDPSGSRKGLGALLLGYYTDEGELRYCGRVGTGFTTRSLTDLRRRLDAIGRPDPPVHPVPKGSAVRRAHWVHPKLVAEVVFSDWTRDDILRQASFKGLREDRDPRDVRRERPAPRPASDTAAGPASRESTSKNARTRRRRSSTSGDDVTKAAGSQRRTSGRQAPVVAGVRLTHPDRVYYPEAGVTKLDLARYYEAVADAMLAFIADRPLTIVRCPEGHVGECFYQKHAGPSFPQYVRRVPIREATRTRNYFSVDSPSGLVYLVQMSTLEFHSWGARRDRVEQPDRLIFDLDPGPGVEWSYVAKAARELRSRLEEVGLQAFVKTTGGKGLHVVAPLQRRSSWDEVKEFARAVAETVVASDPGRFTSNMSKEQRRGKIYIDYLRNARGATAIEIFSTRARPGAPVSVPLRWEELGSLEPGMFTVRTVPDDLSDRVAAWRDFHRVRQSITVAMRKTMGLR